MEINDEQEKGAKSYEQFKDNRKGTSQFPDFVVYAVIVAFGKFDDQLRADLVDVPGEGIGAYDGAFGGVLLCALCGDEHLCGRAQRQVE